VRAPGGAFAVDLSTEVAPAERFDYWQDVICDVFVHLEARRLVPADQFTAALSTVTAGAIRLSRMRVSPHEVTRTTRSINRADQHYHLINMPLNGRCDLLVQDGRSTPLGPGDFALSDTARPYRLRFKQTFDMFVVHLPDELLDGLIPGLRNATATAVRAGDDIGGLLRPLLETIYRRAVREQESGQAHLGAAAVDLIAASLARLADKVSTPGVATPRSVHRMRVRRYINERLSAPDLAPAGIAAANAISVRYLHTLFQEEGTSVSRYIRDRRLVASARDLVDPRLAGLAIAEVAARNGFKDASHFTRAFTKKYGHGPREHRHAAAQRAQGPRSAVSIRRTASRSTW